MRSASSDAKRFERGIFFKRRTVRRKCESRARGRARRCSAKVAWQPSWSCVRGEAFARWKVRGGGVRETLGKAREGGRRAGERRACTGVTPAASHLRQNLPNRTEPRGRAGPVKISHPKDRRLYVFPVSVFARDRWFGICHREALPAWQTNLARSSLSRRGYRITDFRTDCRESGPSSSANSSCPPCAPPPR